MIKVTEKQTKFICDECKKTGNKYRKIYHVLIANKEANLCTECLLVLNNEISKQFHNDIPDRESDTRIQEKLRLLLNKCVSGDWNEDCQKELDLIDVDTLSNLDRLIYRQIKDW